MKGYLQHWAKEYHFYCAPLGDALRVARKAPRSFSTLSLTCCCPWTRLSAGRLLEGFRVQIGFAYQPVQVLPLEARFVGGLGNIAMVAA